MVARDAGALMPTLRQAVVGFLRGWMPPPPDGPWWVQGDAWRVAIDTGFARSASVQIAPDLILCHRGRFIGMHLQEPGDQLSTAAEVNSGLIDAAGGIAVVCRSVEDVAVIEAIGCGSYAGTDHRVEAAALHIQ